MSFHLDAPEGSIAPVALLPGDPFRARHVAEKHLEGAVLHSERRAEYGYTGLYRGQRVSVQATGMGGPSLSIYVHELIVDYGVRTLVRIGTCGSIRPDLGLGDLVAAMAASTNSGTNRLAFGGMDFAPAADFDLLRTAHDVARERGLDLRVGTVLTSDVFYDRPDWWKPWAEHGVLAAEMETSALYTLAARHGARALSLLTISDSVLTGASMAPADRERSLDRMIELALETAIRPRGT